MSRSLRKGPFVDEHLLKKVEDAQNTGNKILKNEKVDLRREQDTVSKSLLNF